MSERWRIIEGDCRDVLRSMPAASVHTVVTSPPYFGLRDYGTTGQIGLEPTPDEFVAALVDVFREVRRILRDDGTVWLNLGDSYSASAPGNVRGVGETSGLAGASSERYRQTFMSGHATKRDTTGLPGVKPKDLLGIPWLVAFALRADGWYLRSDIVWSKPNPMPESVTDRPTKAHEYVFLLSKRASYFYDADAIREVAEYGYSLGTGDRWRGVGSAAKDPQRGGYSVTPGDGGSRNRRSVWTVATQPYAGAHFATFPPKLIEPCILAGAPERACGECEAPWVRVVERTPLAVGRERNVGGRVDGFTRPTGGQKEWDAHVPPRTVGFEPSCSHGDGSARGVVLDPFAGAGTTGIVALQHGREFVGIELNPAYAQMARERIETAVRLGFRAPQNGQAQIDGQASIFELDGAA